jgi:hypothetical protein
VIDTGNLADFVVSEIDMSEIMQLLKPRHGDQLHMCQTHALNTKFPINAVQSLGLHNFAVLLQHFVVNAC